MTKTYYQILGISPHASSTEIARAYKRLARHCHPDLHPNDPQAEERFKEINQAYEALSHSPATHPVPHKRPSTLEKVGELFDDLFGRADHSQSSPSGHGGNDLLVEVYLDFEEAVLGCEKLIRIDEHRRVKVAIPAGTSDGSHVRIAGKGDKANAGYGRDGDLHLEIRVRPHDRFERKGDHILTYLTVPLATALSGGQLSVSTPGGEVSLTIPKLTQGGTQLRLRDKGATNRQTGKRGDLLVTVHLEYPAQLSSSDQQAIRKILEKYRD